jgi:quercetin dioxygenase-like cupin family protein
MFMRRADAPSRALLPGIRLTTLAYGAKTLMGEFRLAAGATIPEHSHPHEQIGYLVAGRLRFYVNEETFDAEPGDAWCLPGGLPHRAEALEDVVAIEVFAPVREDYLPVP